MNFLPPFLLAIFLLTSAAQGQEVSGFRVSLNSGYAVPSSPMTFAEYWKMQAGGSVTAGMRLSSAVDLFGSVEYYRFSLSTTGVRDAFDTKFMGDIWAFNSVTLRPSAPASSILTAAINFRLTSSGSAGIVSPYLVLGAGVLRVSIGEISIATTSNLALDNSSVSFTAKRRIIGGTETTPFGQCGIGLQVRLTEVYGAYLEARFVRAFNSTIGTTYIPIVAGVSLSL